jgi:hypothetical protein
MSRLQKAGITLHVTVVISNCMIIVLFMCKIEGADSTICLCVSWFREHDTIAIDTGGKNMQMKGILRRSICHVK